MQTVVQSLVIALASIVLALAGLVLVRRSAPIATLEAHNEVASAAYQTVATIYAILLAFVCVLAWQRYDAASTDELHEANTIESLHQLAQSFSPSSRSQIEAGLLRYTQVVVNDEWERMASGNESPVAEASINDLWQAYRTLPAADRQEPEYAQSLGEMTQLEDTRGVRLNTAAGQIPRLLWVFLLIGAVIAVAFTYLFGVQNFRSQALITGAVTLTIVGVLLLTSALDDPFRGDVRVRPDSLRAIEVSLTR